jgi:hypothetical protein
VGKIFSVKRKDISLYGKSGKNFCNKIAKKIKKFLRKIAKKKKPKFL